MNGEGERFVHWGCVIIGSTLTVGAVIIVLVLGWRWLWLVPTAAVAFWVFMFLVSVFEDRWRMVTPDHVRRGVPDRCTSCGAEWDVIVRKGKFKTSCPMCGHRGAGDLRS